MINPTPTPTPPKAQESFAKETFYGVPFESLIGKDYSNMSDADRTNHLAALRSARNNPGHKKVEKSQKAAAKGKSNPTQDLLSQLGL